MEAPAENGGCGSACRACSGVRPSEVARRIAVERSNVSHITVDKEEEEAAAGEGSRKDFQKN